MPPLPPLLYAVLGGLAWGLALPDLRGIPLVLLGGWAAGHATRGRLGADLLAGATFATVWMGLAVSWTAEALSLHGADSPRAAVLGLVVVQALPVLLPWALASVLVARRVDTGWAWGIAWMAATLPVSSLQVLPLPPALLAVAVPPAVWPADLGGTPLLSALLVGCGAGLPTPGASIVIGAWFALGALWTLQPPSGRTVRVGLVQPGVGLFDGRRSSKDEARAEALTTLLGELADEAPDLLVAPEAAWPHLVRGPATRRALTSAMPPGVPVVLGIERDDEGRRNTLVVVEDGEVTGRMDKAHLVPLTERAVGSVGRDLYAPGDGDRTLQAGDLRLGGLICYEDAHPAAVRAALVDAPDALLVATNDVLGTGVGPAWHLATSRLAAITSGRPVLRPAMSGPSAVIDAAGRLVWHTTWQDGDVETAARAAVVEVVVGPPHLGGAAVGPASTVGGWVLFALAAITGWPPRRPETRRAASEEAARGDGERPTHAS